MDKMEETPFSYRYAGHVKAVGIIEIVSFMYSLKPTGYDNFVQLQTLVCREKIQKNAKNCSCRRKARNLISLVGIETSPN